MNKVIPELDVSRVRKWAHAKTPPEFRDQMRVEVDETPRGLRILDCRPPWPDQTDSEWMRMPIARLGYSKHAAEWTLYYADRNSRFHRYPHCGPSRHVADLLAEIDADPNLHLLGLTRHDDAADDLGAADVHRLEELVRKDDHGGANRC